MNKSNFFFNINSNQRNKKFFDTWKDYIKEFVDIWKQNPIAFIKFLRGNINDIESFKIIFANEISPHRQLIHTHFLVKVEHDASIHIDTEGIRHFFEKFLKDGVYVEKPQIIHESDLGKVYRYMLKGNIEN